MIIVHSANKEFILFSPENPLERKKLTAFPGLLREGLTFFCPNKHNVFYNLYTRLSSRFKNIRYSAEIKRLIEDPIEIRQIPADFKFHTAPLKHQLIALRFAYTFGNFLNLSQPGLGKTKETLDYIWLMKFKKSLIVCPKSLMFVWVEETLKHRPELSVYVVKTTDWEKERDAATAADLVVVNYDKAVSLAGSLKGLQSDFIAVDEGLIKNPATERTKALTKLSRGIPYRSVMSGTLVNNSPLDVFAPLRFVEPSLVGESFSRFREEYALVSQKNRFITIGYRKVPEIKEMLASCGIVMTKEEWLKDLPPKTFYRKYVQMGDRQRECYSQLATNYLLPLPEAGEGVEIEVDNPLSVLIKLNQISNGFIYYKDQEEESLNELFASNSPNMAASKRTPLKSSERVANGGTRRDAERRHSYEFPKQPKLDALISLIFSSEFNSGTGEAETRQGSGETHLADVVSDVDRGPGLHSGEPGPLIIHRENSGDFPRSLDSGCCEQRAADGTGLDSNRQRNRRAIIWFNMSAELEIIKNGLDRHSIKYLVVSGATKDVGDVINEFNQNPSYQFLVAQAKKVNYGVTVMGTTDSEEVDVVPDFDPLVSDEIFYSLNFSLEVFLQQQDRIHRIGQTRPCRYWLLLTNSKIERRIADRLEEKLICSREILIDFIWSLKDSPVED